MNGNILTPRHEVLIVEDDDALCTLLAAVLRHCGHGFDRARNGNEAIAILRRKSYSAVLLDLMLPDTNGFEVLQFVRAEHPALLPRIIVMTAAAQRTLEHFDTAPIAALVRKPFELDAFIGLVNRTIDPEAFAAETSPLTESDRAR